MKFAFFGSPRFAAIVLKEVVDARFTPSALICNPDRPVGRKKIITPPETKQLILDLGLADQVSILQPEKPSLALAELEALNCDLFVVAAYAKIISKSVLALPRLGTIGVHPSLLPKYRGASPIQSVLLNGEKETGVSLYLLGPGVDDGPVFNCEDIEIGLNDNYDSMEEKLAKLGGRMLSVLLPQLIEGTISPKPQDDSLATLTRKFQTEDGFIAPEDITKAIKEGGELSEMLHNKIRALSAEPGIWTMKDEKRFKIISSTLKDGKLKIERIQKEGKTPDVYRGELD